MPEATSCPCCGHNNLFPALRTQDKHDKVVTIYHCATCCALVPSYLRTAATKVSHQADFHAEYWSKCTKQTLVHEAAEMLHTVDFYGEYIRHFPAETPILDLGGGRGLLTRALLDRGHNARGCDASPLLVQMAHSFLGLGDQTFTNDNIEGFVERHGPELEQRVGTIFLWHVLEHIEHPMKVLSSLKKLLRPDGLIIAQGPLLDKSYIFPEHLFLHSESNIAWITENLGMKLLFLDTYSEERYASFVIAQPDYPKEGLELIYTSDVQDAMGSLFKTLSTAIHLSKRY